MVSPVQDHPVVGMVLEIDRDIILDRAFYCIDGFAGGDACAIADAKDMRVHRLRLRCGKYGWRDF